MPAMTPCNACLWL